MLLETDKKKIGQIFKKYRKDMNLTQFELAEKVGLNEKQISRIEAGLNYPTYMTFVSLIKVLNVNISDFDINNDKEESSALRTFMNMVKTFSEQELKMYSDIIKSIRKNISTQK
ncbi:MAG: helix-turn-helix domain-containing protein [Candidatus Gastranaerophilales bacterium]|nr:helix-turn-helix domain-containing protein [Candidatus Gastranaerophilales bacterium]